MFGQVCGSLIGVGSIMMVMEISKPMKQITSASKKCIQNKTTIVAINELALNHRA